MEGIRRNPKSAYLYLIKGLNHEDSGDHDRAIADLVAIQHDPLDAFAYLSRGQCYVAKDQTDCGLADLDEAFALTQSLPQPTLHAVGLHNQPRRMLMLAGVSTPRSMR